MGDVSTKSLIYKLADDVKDLANTLKVMQDNQVEMKRAIEKSDEKLYDPEDGVIAKTIRNTEFREMCEPERNELIGKFHSVLRWKSTIEWVGGAVFLAVLGAVVKIIFFS